MGVPQVMVLAEGNGSLGATLPQGVKDPSIPRIVDSSSWVISDFQSCHGWFSAALVVQLQRDKRGSLWPAPALPIVITLPSRSLLPCLCCVEYPYIRDELLKRSPHVTGSAVVVALQLLKQTQNRRRRRCSHSVSPPLNVTWRMLRAFGKRFSPPPFSGSLGPSLPPITDT